ncbi:hypothetical protein CYMTET_33823, partial [Cymbomonas tetramitiformis]
MFRRVFLRPQQNPAASDLQLQAAQRKFVCNLIFRPGSAQRPSLVAQGGAPITSLVDLDGGGLNRRGVDDDRAPNRPGVAPGGGAPMQPSVGPDGSDSCPTARVVSSNAPAGAPRNVYPLAHSHFPCLNPLSPRPLMQLERPSSRHLHTERRPQPRTVTDLQFFTDDSRLATKTNTRSSEVSPIGDPRVDNLRGSQPVLTANKAGRQTGGESEERSLELLRRAGAEACAGAQDSVCLEVLKHADGTSRPVGDITDVLKCSRAPGSCEARPSGDEAGDTLGHKAEGVSGHKDGGGSDLVEECHFQGQMKQTSRQASRLRQSEAGEKYNGISKEVAERDQISTEGAEYDRISTEGAERDLILTEEALRTGSLWASATPAGWGLEKEFLGISSSSQAADEGPSREVSESSTLCFKPSVLADISQKILAASEAALSDFPAQVSPAEAIPGIMCALLY